MTHRARRLIAETRQGQLWAAQIVLEDGASRATLHLAPKGAPRLEGAEPSLALALEAAGYASGVAIRLEAPYPGGVVLLVDGREQKVIGRYGEVFRRVAALADAYADSL